MAEQQLGTVEMLMINKISKLQKNFVWNKNLAKVFISTILIISSFSSSARSNNLEKVNEVVDFIVKEIDTASNNISEEDIILKSMQKFEELFRSRRDKLSDDSRNAYETYSAVYSELFALYDAVDNAQDNMSWNEDLGLWGKRPEYYVQKAVNEALEEIPESVANFGYAKAYQVLRDYHRPMWRTVFEREYFLQYGFCCPQKNQETSSVAAEYVTAIEDFAKKYVEASTELERKIALSKVYLEIIKVHHKETEAIYRLLEKSSANYESSIRYYNASYGIFWGYLEEYRAKSAQKWFNRSLLGAAEDMYEAQATTKIISENLNVIRNYEKKLHDQRDLLNEEIAYDVIYSGGSCRDLLKYNGVGYWTCVDNKNGVRDRALADAERQRQVDRVSTKSAELNKVLDELFDKAEAALISRNLPAYEEARALYDATRKELEALYIDDAEFVEGNVPIRRWSEEDRGWTGLHNKYTSLANRRNLMNEMASSCDLSKLAGALNQGRMSRDLYNWNYDRCLNWARKLKAIPEGAVGFFFEYNVVTGRNSFTESSTSDEEILSLVGSDGAPHSELALEFLEHSRDPLYFRAYRERSNYSFTSSNGQPVLTSGGRFANTKGGNLAHQMSINCRREPTRTWSFSGFFPPLPVSERCKDWARQYFELGGSMELLRRIIQADSETVEVYSAIRENVREKAVRKILAEPDLPNANDDDNAGADEATSQGQTCANSYPSEWWEINCPK